MSKQVDQTEKAQFETMQGNLLIIIKNARICLLLIKKYSEGTSNNVPS